MLGYSTEILASGGLPWTAASYFFLVATIVAGIGSVVSLTIMKYIGRRKMIVCSISGIAISLLLMCVFHTLGNYGTHTASYLLGVCLSFLYTAYGVTFPLVQLLPNELFEQRARDPALTVVSVVYRFSAFVLALVFPVVMEFSNATVAMIPMVALTLTGHIFLFFYSLRPRTEVLPILLSKFVRMTLEISQL